jgi:NADPH:quinone reductase-like Zn-dependent oxidoreductase
MRVTAVSLEIREASIFYGSNRVLDRVSLSAAGGEFIALLGASGCGKTTLLRSGEIVATGPGVSELRVGEQVYGVTNSQFIGAYAEYALASAAMVSSKPISLTYIEAASVPVISVTAWQALFDQAQLKAGQTVVIHGAAGNVGSYAVQLARRAGVQTIATVATEDIPFVRDLGANKVIDYRTQRFEEEVRDAAAVIHLVGGETQNRSFQVLRRGGKLISAVSRPDQHLVENHGVEAAFFLVNITSQYLAEIFPFFGIKRDQKHVVDGRERPKQSMQ